MQEQTDLPLLVRKDNGHFLRGNDVTEGEREDQFFWWDSTLTDVLTPAPRGTLARWRSRSRARGELRR